MSNKIESALYIRSANNALPSLDSQRSMGEGYATQHSLHLSIIEDSHASRMAPLNERAGLGWLIQLVEFGLIKTVIVDSYHRISRNFVELSSFLSLLKKHNVKLIVIDGGGEFDK